MKPGGEDARTIVTYRTASWRPVGEMFMRTKAKDIDAFDRAYCDRIRDFVWNAILEASLSPQ